jgi:hypothetical protein
LSLDVDDIAHPALSVHAAVRRDGAHLVADKPAIVKGVIVAAAGNVR